MNLSKLNISIAIAFLLISTVSCDITPQENSNNSNPKATFAATSPLPSKRIAQSISDKSTHNVYSWLSEFSPENALTNRIPTPVGFQRAKMAKNSFGDWLRHLPLKPEGTKVMLHNGAMKGNQRAHFAVIDIDTGTRNLQQCADAIMRLKAEYHYGLQQFEQIHFNYTSGDKVSFEDWRYGKQPQVSGNNVTFSSRTNISNNSYENFKQYMLAIFYYAGTYSLEKETLEKEMRKVPVNDMQIGDVVIQGGFPGHGVIVVDMAVDSKTGEKLFMLAQSYMPAQDMHILKNPMNRDLSPWYSTNFKKELYTPEWTFEAGDLRRFRN